MDDDLPTDFDIIVIGTGMTESIVAAAASRIGKRVLHLDSDDFYGGMWASFNFESIQKLIDDSKAKSISDSSINFGIFNVEDSWFINKDSPAKAEDAPKEETAESADPSSEKSGDAEKKNELDWTQDKLKKEYRKFNIDLAPKLLFARGELVELLISSNIARYAEFRCVNRVLTWLDNSLEPVPCSRADVFATKHVTVVEKRMLMKLLTSFMDHDKITQEFQGFENKTLLDYLKSKKLTGNLIHYVIYAIAGGTDNTPCMDGVERCKKFLTSLGRYGNTPFLWSMYGSGELPQCFCRLCAVFGGVYCLKRQIDSIKVEEDNEDPKKSVKIQTQNKLLTCEHVVMGIDKAPKEFLPTENLTKGLSRAVFVINKSMLDYEKESLTLLQFPPLEGRSDPVTVIELGPSTSSCPKGLYIVHMTCPQTKTSKEDLQEYAEKLFSFEQCDSVKSYLTPVDSIALQGKPQVLWCLYFNMIDTSQEGLCKSFASRIHLCSGPDIELDFDHAVKQGREIFNKICEGAEFLPRAPDPEEIILEGDDSEAGPVFETKVPESEEEIVEGGK